SQHQCSVRDCQAAVGSLCTHVRLACRLCSRIGHLTGDSACPDLRAPSSPPSSSPNSGKLVSEETSKLGITDGSISTLVKDSRTAAVEAQLAAKAASTKTGRPRSSSL